MKQGRKRALALLLTAVLITTGICTVPAARAEQKEENKMVTVLFTHDTHSHLLPAADEDGGEYGGYNRLATLMKEQRAAAEKSGSAVLTVDGGDFSMGSLFQTIYTQHASELRMLGALECDVTTFGNHEFDYRAKGLAEMLNAAAESRETSADDGLPHTVPEIVQANYVTPKDPEDAGSIALQEALTNYGVKPYTMVEKNGVRFAVFGILGEDADMTAPMSGMELQDPKETAKAVVKEIQENETYDYLICLSHSGTDGKGGGEDVELAKAVEGIDLIVSGHTHSTLAEPLEVKGTYIVSCGEYTENLGVIQLEKENGKTKLVSYGLLPVDETVEDDPEMTAYAEGFKRLVEQEYLSQFGYGFDEVLAENPVEFVRFSEFAREQKEEGLGNLIADSFVAAVKKAEGENYVPVDFAVTASGVVRGSLAQGEITVSDAFNVSSLGSGADGSPGYPLVSAYLTGKELKDAFEVDASVTPLMSYAQLYSAGMEWTFNPHRMIFDKVTECHQVLPDGSTAEIEDDKLYRVVTGLYCAQMLGMVEEKSFGILSITPRDENGDPVEDMETRILHNPDGSEVKEWFALADYLHDLKVVPARYGAPEGRKNVEDSRSPAAVLKDPGTPTIVAGAAVAGVAVLAGGAVSLVRKHRKKKKKQ